MEKFKGFEKRIKASDSEKTDITNIISLGNGRFIEKHIDPKTNELKNWFIKDKENKIISFSDMQGEEKIRYFDTIKERFPELNFNLKDEELKFFAKEICRDNIENSIDNTLDNFDEKKASEN
ncbi:MAG: hypothetical protein AAB596_02370 [Patescibacteria group bacterium]